MQHSASPAPPTPRRPFRTPPITPLMVIAALLPISGASAGVITDFTWHTGVASVAGEPVIVPPPAQWNQNYPGISPNLIHILQKDYHAIGPVDLVFTVMETGGITEYRVNEGVSNSSGVEWLGYRLELGFGIGDDFVQAASGDLTFDSPDFDSPVDVPFFPSISVSAYDITASGDTLPGFAYMGGIVFHVNVPDGITEFTIRQSPIPIPTPGGAALLLIAPALHRSRRR